MLLLFFTASPQLATSQVELCDNESTEQNESFGFHGENDLGSFDISFVISASSQNGFAIDGAAQILTFRASQANFTYDIQDGKKNFTDSILVPVGKTFSHALPSEPGNLIISVMPTAHVDKNMTVILPDGVSIRNSSTQDDILQIASSNASEYVILLEGSLFREGGMLRTEVQLLTNVTIGVAKIFSYSSRPVTITPNQELESSFVFCSPVQKQPNNTAEPTNITVTFNQAEQKPPASISNGRVDSAASLSGQLWNNGTIGYANFTLSYPISVDVFNRSSAASTGQDWNIAVQEGRLELAFANGTVEEPLFPLGANVSIPITSNSTVDIYTTVKAGRFTVDDPATILGANNELVLSIGNTHAASFDVGAPSSANVTVSLPIIFNASVHIDNSTENTSSQTIFLSEVILPSARCDGLLCPPWIYVIGGIAAIIVAGVVGMNMRRGREHRIKPSPSPVEKKGNELPETKRKKIARAEVISAGTDRGQCPICSDDIASNETAARCPSCKTILHAECMNDYITDFQACPSCGIALQPHAK